MKNVLFVTTALVAFAGAAAAESHGGVTLDWSGEANVGYNDVLEGGLFWDVTLTVDASVDLGDYVTASLAWDVVSADQFGASITDDIPTVTIGFDNGTIAAKLIAGDQDDDGASEMWYADRDGMALDVWNWDNNANDYTAVVEFGNFGVAATTCYSCSGTSYGATAAFGSIELGFGYDDGVVSSNTAVSADATFGSFDVGASYITDGSDDSIGIAVGGTFGAMEVGAYYAINSADDDGYGISVDYSAGALSVGAYFDVMGDTTYGVDVAYELSDMLTASAGIYDDATDMQYYVGIEYTVNDNISATVSYATADEISGPEFKDGISAFITATF